MLALLDGSKLIKVLFYYFLAGFSIWLRQGGKFRIMGQKTAGAPSAAPAMPERK
jgi:hypothetical protein